MAIEIRCTCGKTLQVPDTAAGKRVRCGNCQTVLNVPGPANSISAVPTVRPVESSGSTTERPVAAEPPHPRRKSSGGSKVWIFALLGVGAMLLLGCVTIGGVVAYFAFSGSSSESQLIGNWEMDPEPWQKVAEKAPLGGMFMPDVKLTFNKDHTFKLVMIVEMEGRWKVVSRSGNQLQVKMIAEVMGFDQSNPPTVTITIVDKDHIDFASNHQSMQMAGRFRRVGTGPPVASTPARAPGAVGGSGAKGRPAGGGMPGLDAGMKPDCEVEWGGTWFPAKILKTEKDRWFIHYVGWPSNWDEWVDQKRIRFKK